LAEALVALLISAVVVDYIMTVETRCCFKLMPSASGSIQARFQGAASRLSTAEVHAMRDLNPLAV
jgi:hypothetical protein